MNLADNGTDELMQDLIAIITSFSAWLYGQRRAKRQTEKIIAELKYKVGDSVKAGINHHNLLEIRLVPRLGHYVIEVVYETRVDEAITPSLQSIAAIDLGLDNLATIEQLTYKLENVGTKVIVAEESYTSKSSFLDWDNIPIYTQVPKHQKPSFSGKRIKRAWYKSQDGTLIHADLTLSGLKAQRFLKNFQSICSKYPGFRYYLNIGFGGLLAQRQRYLPRHNFPISRR